MIEYNEKSNNLKYKKRWFFSVFYIGKNFFENIFKNFKKSVDILF